MIDWATASAALLGLIDSVAFDTKPYAFRTTWADRKQSGAYVGTSRKTGITLRVRSIGEIGEDETRLVEAEIEGEDVIANAQVGNRRVIIELRVESYANTDALWAWTTIERIRSRLRRASSIAVLEEIDFALVSIGQSVTVPTVREDHEWSVCVAELTFNTRFCDADIVAAPWIDSVEATAELDGVDGAEMPDPPNYVTTITRPAP